MAVVGGSGKLRSMPIRRASLENLSALAARMNSSSRIATITLKRTMLEMK